MQPAQAFIGIGANLGDRWDTIRRALVRLRQTAGVASLEQSPVYESDPVGMLEQPQFLNLVVGVETTLSPEELLRLLLEIEQQFGRERAVRWGPRTIDLDLLLHADEARQGPELQLPHPRMFERAFVTEPLRELLQRPRFQVAAWDGLRGRLAALSPPAGLRSWAPA